MIFFLLCYIYIKSIFSNIIHQITNIFFPINDIKINSHGHKTSIYWNYILCKFLMTFKFIIANKIYEWCMRKINIDCKLVDVTIRYSGNDHDVIIEIPEILQDHTTNITYISEYVKKNINSKNQLIVGSADKIMKSCMLIDAKNETDIKKILQLYRYKYSGNTLANVLEFNGFVISDNTQIRIMYFGSGGLTTHTYYVSKLPNKQVIELF